MQRAFFAAAERHRGLILPGYTHLQRAQPVLATHYFLAYLEKLERDRGRLADCRKRLNSLPLVQLPWRVPAADRPRFRGRRTGVRDVAANSLDISSDRDFALESVFVLTLIAEHLAGWAEEWILWSTQEFGFLALPDAICTGSSIMPQKKNPDVLELIRGRAARVIGELTTLMVLVKGLPLAYNRDLQEDKEPVFDAFDTVEACLDLAAVVVEGASLRAEHIARRLDEGFLDATTLMEFLIQQGVPQRTAHDVIGRLVGQCESRGLKRLADLSDADLLAAHPALGPGTRERLGVANAIEAFQSYGSTAPCKLKRRCRAGSTNSGCNPIRENSQWPRRRNRFPKLKLRAPFRWRLLAPCSISAIGSRSRNITAWPRRRSSGRSPDWNSLRECLSTR